MYGFNKLYNCGIFQGAGKHRHYFEGWYFKHVDQAEENIISVIPGVSFEEGRGKSHAFVQIIDGSTCKTHYVRYGIDEFEFSKDRFDIKIGNNSFSDREIRLDIDRDSISMKGQLNYSNIVPWHSSLLSPSSMGWYAFIPVMECYHGVLSLHHNISGSLIMNKKEISFDRGAGYMEKDWGTSFPGSWIWLQSNHLDTPGASFMASIARIPWRGKNFTGFIVGLWHKGRLYRFTTYTGAAIDAVSYYGTAVELRLSDKKYQLMIIAQQGITGGLQAPVKGAMVGTVQESISGIAEIILKDKKTDSIILNASARCCGMEVAGNIQELVSLS